MAEEHYDLIVIGSGPAGEKGAARAAYEGKSVALVEASPELGGALTSSGVPTKALRETALNISGFLSRDIYGVDLRYKEELDVQTFLYREQYVQRAAENAVMQNLDKHHICLYHGFASFDDPHTLRVDSPTGTTSINADVILIATGSRPARPASFPFDSPNVYDSTTILKIHRLPGSLTIVGGGIIGCEYACLFGALGIHVNLIHSQDQLFPFVDREISMRLLESLRYMGLDLYMNERVEKVEPDQDGTGIRTSLKSGKIIQSEAVLVAVGRVSNTEKLRLENAGIQVGERGLLKVNDHLQTEVPHIYAAGDVIGFPALSSTSMEQGRLAVTHAFNFNYRTTPLNQIPFGIWTIPEISVLGETEENLQARSQPYLVGKALYENNPRGLVLGEKYGMLKLLFSATDLKLLGVHIIGQEACELIATGMMALEAGASARDFIGLCFNFPSLGDMYKYAAYDAIGEYREGVDRKAELKSASDPVPG